MWLEKAEKKRTPDWPVHSSWLCNGNEQEKKWCYVTGKAHSHSPSGSQVEDWAPPLCRRWGGVKRCVWERYGRAEEGFCLVGEDNRAGRQKKLCLNRDVASHFDA